MEGTITPDDITNGDRNVPHGESASSSAGVDAQGSNVNIKLIEDSQTASVQQDSAKQLISNKLDQTDVISKEQTIVDSTEGPSGVVLIVDSNKENSVAAAVACTGTANEAAEEVENKSSELEHTAQAVKADNEDLSENQTASGSSFPASVVSGSSTQVEEPIGNTVLVKEQRASTGTTNEVVKEVESNSSELETIPQVVETGNEELSEKHSASETSLVVSASTMEVEEQTDNVPSAGAVQDSIACKPSVRENLIPPPSVPPKAALGSVSSMDVEEPRENFPSAATINEVVEQQRLESEAVKTAYEAAEEVKNKSSELEHTPQAVKGDEDLSENRTASGFALAAPAVSGSSMEVEEPIENTVLVKEQLASTGTTNEVVKEVEGKSSELESIPQVVETGNEELSEKHSASDNSLAASASTMEVEEQTDNVSSAVAGQDSIASTVPANEVAKEEEGKPSVHENLMPPPSVPPKAALGSVSSKDVEEPRENVPSAATINEVAEQQRLESEAVKKINSTSLALLSEYSGSSESESEDTDASISKQVSPPSSSSDDSEDDVKEPELSSQYRKCDDAILVSDAETMDTNAASSDDDDEDPHTQEPIRTKGEMLVDELPPIEELTITVPETECKAIGLVDSIVAQIVLVQSVPGVELLNIDTVLFLDRGKRPLGKIFDVIGQVNCPIYCVLFNSNQEVVSRNITVGLQVYCAPRTEHTSFIILSELMRYKGSDASWMNDNEPPPHMVEYSDDEAEKTAKRNRRKKANVTGEQSGETSQQTHPDRQQQPQQYHQRQEQHHHNHRQQQYQYPYMPRQQFGWPPPNNRGNFYPRQQSGYSWHHNVNNPRYHHPPQYQQQHPQYQQHPQQQHPQYQQHPQQQQHQPHYPQHQPQFQAQQQQPPQQQFQQFPNTQTAPGAAYLPNPFAMFGQQPPNPPS